MVEIQVGAADTQRIRQLVTGYQVARALLAADELGVVKKLLHGLPPGIRLPGFGLIGAFFVQSLETPSFRDVRKTPKSMKPGSPQTQYP